MAIQCLLLHIIGWNYSDDRIKGGREWPQKHKPWYFNKYFHDMVKQRREWPTTEILKYTLCHLRIYHSVFKWQICHTQEFHSSCTLLQSWHMKLSNVMPVLYANIYLALVLVFIINMLKVTSLNLARLSGNVVLILLRQVYLIIYSFAILLYLQNFLHYLSKK